jgi:hypothetical protein
MSRRSTLLRSSLLLLLLGTARAGEVEVLRAERRLTYLSSNGNGASIYRLQAVVDLRVEDLAFQKRVGLRWSSDGWQTSGEATGYWVEDWDARHERWRVELDLGTVGRNVRLGAERGDMGPAWLAFDAFVTQRGQTTLDDAGGRHHGLALLAPAAEPLPQARSAPRALALGGDLVLVGGQEREGYRFTVPDVLRLRDGAWERVTELPPLPVGPGQGPTLSPTILASYEAVAAGRELLLLGGTAIHVGTRFTSLLRFDPASGAWRRGADLPGPHEDRRAVVHQGEVHLIPITRARPPGDAGEVWIYDLAGDAWRREPLAGLELLDGTGFVVAPAPGRAWLLGGRTGAAGASAPLHQVLVYEAAERRVRRAGSCPLDLGGAEPALALDRERVVVANVGWAPGQDTAEAWEWDGLAGSFRALPATPALAWGAVLAAPPAALIAPPGSGQGRRVAPLFVLAGGSQVDAWDPETGLLARGAARTVVRVQRRVAFGERVTLRGDRPPFSWGRGVDCRWTPGDLWVFETTELLSPDARWKPLVDDRRWLPGTDLTLRRGETTTVTFYP